MDGLLKSFFEALADFELLKHKSIKAQLISIGLVLRTLDDVSIAKHYMGRYDTFYEII